MKDERVKKLEQDNVGKEILTFIPNNLGINLCSIRNITISRQKDGQLKDIHITFNPSYINGNQRIVADWQSDNPNGKKIDCCRETGVSRPTIDKYWNTNLNHFPKKQAFTKEYCERLVTEWKINNPYGKKVDCCRDTGLSRPTVYKYWNTDTKRGCEE